MRFVRKWLLNRAIKEREFEPATGEQLRQNVIKQSARQLKTEKQILSERLAADPPDHPEILLHRLGSVAQHALRLAMVDWRAGTDPSPHLSEIKRSFDDALTIRPSILPGAREPSFAAILSIMMRWNLPFNTDPPADETANSAVQYLEQWLTAGLADPAVWPMKERAAPVKNQFVQKSLDDYWALLTDQIDPEEGVRRCIRNFNRRATHPTFKALPSFLGGGAYNELFVDYTLSAIMKQRGLTSGSVHDWKWD